MIRKYINGTVKVMLSCIIAASMIGCTTREPLKETYNVFKAENSSGYVFEMHVDDEGNVVKVVENGEEYDAGSLAGVQTVVDELGLNVFYETQSYTVSDGDSKVTYNDEDYSEARKDLFSEYLNITNCSKTDGDLLYMFEFESEEDKIVGMNLSFLYKGDFTKFKGNEELIMSVVNYVKSLIVASFNEMDLSSEDAAFEILNEGMKFTVHLDEGKISGENADLITAIISLTDKNQGFVCQ